jgi:RNA polymerase sigma-70 factor, ECF subfamily
MPGNAKSGAAQGVISPGEVPGDDREDRGGEPDREGDSAGDPAGPRVEQEAQPRADGSRDAGDGDDEDDRCRLAAGSDGAGVVVATRDLTASASDVASEAGGDSADAAGADAADRRELERAIAEHLPALRARAAQLCRGHGDADDIVQEALLRAFRARRQMREIAKLRGWLLTILTNTFLDSLRRRKARPGEVELQFDLPAPSADDDDSPWSRIDLDAIRAAVAELPDDVRQTYEMFAFEGRDYTGISSALGVPKATVGTRILRARKRLRGLLMREL